MPYKAKDNKESEEFKWVDWVVDKTNQIPTNINDFKIGQKFVIDKDDNNRGPYRVEVIKTNVIDFDGYGNRRTDTIKVKSLDDFTKKLWGDNFLVRPDYIINNILNGTWRLVDDIKESEKNEFEWVKDISMMLGFDDLKIGDIVKLKGYDPNDWEVVDIYMTASYMTGKPSEKRIKFKGTKGNSYGNSYLELWKSSLNSENYFELVDRKLFESEEGQFDWVKDSISEFESSPAFGYYQEIKDLLQDDYTIKIEESRTSKSKVFKIYDLYGDIVDAWSERHFRPEIIEEDLKSQTEFYRDRISVLYELLVPFFKKHGLIKNINESEEDDFEWAKETVKDSFLEYRHKEIMIDIRELSLEELKKLYDIVLPYTNDKGIFINDEGEEIYWGDNLQCFKNIIDGSLLGQHGRKKKTISLHCGIEDNEYRPLKGAICCLSTTYEDEPNKENIIPINAKELIGGKINESEEWYNEILSEKPLLKFDDLMVGDVIVNISPNFLTRSPESKFQLTYFNVLSFEDGKTWRNAYEEPEKYVICNLVKEDPDTGNFIPVSRTDLKFPRGTNQPIWTLIYREGVLEESEWFEDIVSDPIMLKVEDLEMGDIVIPTCVKEGEYIVNGKGTSVKLLHEPTHWVTLKRNTNVNTGGVFIEHDSEIGKNCRFKLVHRENNIIEESKEDEFNWAEDIIANTTEEIDITDSFDLWKNKLVEGSVVKITGTWEGMDFEDDVATIVNPADEAGNPLLKFDRVIYEFGNTDEGNHTHCGENETENIKCECQRRQRNRDEVGKCWWTNLHFMEKIIYLPFEGKQITESEENDFSWVEDITKYLKVGQKFKVKTSAQPLIVQIVKIVKKIDVNRNTIYFSPINLANTNYPGVPMNVQRLMTHINSGNWIPINDIKESEEDSELFWAEDLLQGALKSIDITTKPDMMQMLPVGSILKIEGYQDGLSLENDECQLIEKGHSASGQDSTYCLFKFKHEIRNDEDEPTHCGSFVNPKQKKICECREPMEDEYAPDGRVGKCWWVQLEDMNRVIYYPSKLNLVENKTKKPLLTEGRYDAITRKAVRDIMKLVTTSSFGDHDLPYDINNDEYEYQQENLGFSVELQIIKTKKVEDFFIDAATSDNNEDETVMLIKILLNPNFDKQNLEKLFYKLQEIVRHEIEHFTQHGPFRIEDRPTYKGDTAQLKTVYGHHKNVIEVPALVHGFYRRAKLEKRPLDEIMMEDLDSEIEKGFLTKNQAEKLLSIWIDYAKKNLPAAIYKQN